MSHHLIVKLGADLRKINLVVAPLIEGHKVVQVLGDPT
jgi:hypothetical protein